MVIRYRRIVSFLCILVLIAAPAAAYEILLDIDTDYDPTTINDLTYESSALVKLILAPSYPGEPIGHVEFGLGGSCLECDMVHEYGVAHNLLSWGDMWLQASAFMSGADYATFLGCPADPGYHLVLWFEPVGGGRFYLDQPFFMAEFEAWVADPVPQGCQQPPSNLATMPALGQFWNYVQLGGPAVDNEATSWSAIKAAYR